MESYVNALKTFSLFSTAFLLMYLLIINYKRLNSMKLLPKNVLSGSAFSAFIFINMFLSNLLFNTSHIDSIITIVFFAGVFFGLGTGIPAAVTCMSAGVILFDYEFKSLLLSLIISIMLGYFSHYYYFVKGTQKAVLPYVYVISVISNVQPMLWVYLLDPDIRSFNEATDKLLSVIFVMPVMLYFIINAFIYEIQRQNKEVELKKAKDDLAAQNEDIIAAYEEISAADETLREQYDQLLQSQESLRVSEERYRLIMEVSNDILWEWDLNANKWYISKADNDLIDFLNIKENSEEVEAWFSRVHTEDLPMLLEYKEKVISNILDNFIIEYRVLKDDGSYKWIQSKAAVIRENGNATRIAGSYTDISEKKNQEMKIKRLAYTDSLTDLPNRAAMLESLEKALNEEKSGWIIFVDIDNFKWINDIHGHAFGDKVISVAAKRLEGIHQGTVSRFGGDEFIVTLYSVKDSGNDEILGFIEKVNSCFEEPFEIEKISFKLTCSIGAARFPKHGNMVNDLVKKADMAKHNAKNQGKGCFVIFDESMNIEMILQHDMENQLEEAIENNEIVVFYQPQYDIRNNVLIGFEALARWNHKRFGFVPPDKFIKIAEEKGMIFKLGENVLRNVCKFIRIRRSKEFKQVRVAVNVSAIQLNGDNFVEKYHEIVIKEGVCPGDICIEITESSVMDSFEDNHKKILQLQELGYKVSLDDFGTGYSSLNHLKNIPVQEVKVDKSFIDDVSNETKYRNLIKAIIEISKDFGFELMAEGVETHEQKDTLKSLGLDRIQGYLLGKPLPFDEALEIK